MLDPAVPLPDISADEPAGPNLEFDAEFAEFERNAQGKPEQQYGSTVVPAEEPDWKQVVAGAWALLERTYDLRVLARLAVGRLQREGMVGYAETLALIRQMLETRWSSVHPQLDPEDDNDPTLRANALLMVAEPLRVMRTLRTMPLARSARAGTVSWRDIAISTGAVEVEEEGAKMAPGIIAAAFRETDAAARAVLQAALASAVDSAAAISTAFDEAAGYGTGPDLAELVKLLRDMQRMVVSHTPAADEAAMDPVEVETAPDSPGEPERPRQAGGTSIASLGPVTRREDAMRLLDLVIEYYERNEPSSPLPLLIARARRLADKDFLELLRDLAPDGVGQAGRVFGTPEE